MRLYSLEAYLAFCGKLGKTSKNIIGSASECVARAGELLGGANLSFKLKVADKSKQLELGSLQP